MIFNIFCIITIAVLLILQFALSEEYDGLKLAIMISALPALICVHHITTSLPPLNPKEGTMTVHTKNGDIEYSVNEAQLRYDTNEKNLIASL